MQETSFTDNDSLKFMNHDKLRIQRPAAVNENRPINEHAQGCSSDIASSFFSVQVKSGACYITGQWGRVQSKMKEI